MNKYLFFVLVFFLFFSFVQAQDEQPGSLDELFMELKEQSNNYQNYEVIPQARLNSFWNTVQDSIGDLKQNLQQAQNRISEQQQEISEINENLQETKEALAESEYTANRWTILGIHVLKDVFVTVVFSIIAGLIITLAVIGIKFKVNEKVTRKKKRDYQELAEEFEEYRKIVRQREIKIKRELQTERNKLEELKHKSTK